MNADINHKYSSERPTQSSRLREAIDAVQRMYDNKPDDDDMELVQKVAEKHSSWIAVHPTIISGSTRANVIKLRGYFSDLRPEEATQEDHSNKYIQLLREVLWTPERSQAYPRGSRTYEESTGYRPGQQEKAWRQRVSWGGELPHQLKPYDTDMRNACAYLDRKYSGMLMGQVLKYLSDLDDPRVGSTQKAEILADNPMPKQGAVKFYRAFDKQMIDSVLLKTIDASIGELEGSSPTSEHPNVQDARHVLIQALRNFRRAYAFWLFPRADSMTDVFERSSNGSPDIQELSRGKGTKRENDTEREDGRKYGKGSRGERQSTG